MALAAGTRLGPYKILAPLGAGGMGEVYRARDSRVDREVAVKVLPGELSSDAERRHRFEREARAASSLNHPNIITIHDIDEHDGTHCIAMELVEGRTLRDLLAEGPLPGARLLALGRQIAEGLAKAHAAGIVHRDLKPENLMVTEDGLVKILDFGLAKLAPRGGETASNVPTAEQVTSLGAVLGTAPYMSPEQAAGRPVDHRSDQFSLGSVLYEMATGRRAFKKDTAAQTLTAIIEEEPDPSGEWKRDLQAPIVTILERCLAKDPRGRYASTGDLATALQAVPETPGASSVRRGALLTTSKGDRPTPSWRTRLTGVIAVLVLVGLAITVSRQLFRGDDLPPRIESLAVLPLQSLTGAEEEYFADGMTEALIGGLAKLGSLRVVSRTSAMRYKETDKSLPEIASELGVDAVVEGSVLRAGDEIRISVQLVEAVADRNLWAESYTGPMRDVLALQNDVARAIAREIELKLSPGDEVRLAHAPAVDSRAYEAYLKGLYHFYRLTPEELDRAQEYFELALDRDPDFALAYTGIADVWGSRTYWGSLSPAEAMPLARKAADEALRLDDSLARAHAMRAKLFLYADHDWSAARQELRTALELSPNDVEVLLIDARILTALGDLEPAWRNAEKARELDPLNPMYRAIQGAVHVAAGRYQDAIAELRGSLVVEPRLMVAQALLWGIAASLGRETEAFEAAHRMFSLRGDFQVAGAMKRAYEDSGYRAAMRATAETLVSRSEGRYVQPTLIAEAWAHAGHEERALDWLERGYDIQDPSIVLFGWYPGWDMLRAHPRFRSLEERLGLPSHALEANLTGQPSRQGPMEPVG